MDIEKVKRYSLAELTLLALFAMGLLAAWIIVKARDHVPLSAPIALDGTGLSVSVPVGTGWEHTPAWGYETDNSMALLAQRRVMQSGVELRWRYVFCAPQISLQEVLKERLKETQAVVEPVEMPAGSSMEAVRISTPPQTQEPTYFFAMANLGHGRRIELQVTPEQLDFDLFYAETLLKDAALSMVYQTTEEMAAGTALLKQFYETMETAQPKEESFLISEARGRTTGFYYAKHEPDNGGAVRRIETRYYETQQFMMEGTLKIGRRQQPFNWQTRLTVPMTTGLRSYEIQADENGRLNVSSNFEAGKTLYPDPFILPEAVLSEFVRLYLEGTEESVVTLAIAGIGQVAPIRIRKIDPQEATARSEEVRTAVRVEYLHSADFFDELYFDEQRRLVGRFERQPRRPDRLWDRVEPEELRHVFGDKLKIVERSGQAEVSI